eukprot:Hpha_TRINITY_DN15360_c3_g9::TRINITY_DN15360_c3_g9_i1::g.90449::m.90449
MKKMWGRALVERGGGIENKRGVGGENGTTLVFVMEIFVSFFRCFLATTSLSCVCYSFRLFLVLLLLLLLPSRLVTLPLAGVGLREHRGLPKLRHSPDLGPGLLVRALPGVVGVVLGPLTGRFVVLPPVLVEQPLTHHRLLLARHRAKAPPAGVGVPVHDNALDLRYDTVIASGDHRGGHLRDTDSNTLPLRRHHNNLITGLDAVLEAQKSGEHELGSVADGVNGSVLQHKALVAREEHFTGEDYSTEVRIVLVRFVHPLRVQQIMHRRQPVVFVQETRSRAAQFLHVPPGPEQQAEVHTERPDVGTALAVNFEKPEVPLLVELDELILVDSTHPKLPLHRGDNGGALEHSTLQHFQRTPQLTLLHCVVQAEHAHVLLTGVLLRLNKSSRAVDTDDERPRHLRVQGPCVPGLVHLQDPLHPGNNLVGGGVGGLVQIKHAVLQKVCEVAAHRGGPRIGTGGVVVRTHVKLVDVFHQQRPVAAVQPSLLLVPLQQEVSLPVQLLVVLRHFCLLCMSKKKSDCSRFDGGFFQ